MLTLIHRESGSLHAQFLTVLDVQGQKDFHATVTGRPPPARRRLGLFAWALAAGVSAAMAVASSVGDGGGERIAMLFGREPVTQMTQMAQAEAPPVEDATGTSAEIARLKNQTRLLALEKKALSMRLALLTKARDELTGSIDGQPAPRAADRGTVAVTPGPAGAVEVTIADLPVDGDFADASPLQDTRVIDSEVAGIPAPVRQPPVRQVSAGQSSAGRSSAGQAVVPGGSYAMQLASAETVEEIRDAWTKLRDDLPKAVSGLAPLVAMDDRHPDRLWLLAGRFEKKEAAETRCAMVALAGRSCSVTTRQARPLPIP